MLAATGITVRAAGRPLIAGVDLTARPGQVTAIIGPNGSGKTTLLRALTGEVACTGRVTLGGRDIARIPPAELATLRAVLPQAIGMAFPFTVREVVALGLTGRRAAAPGAGALVQAALARVGLAGHAGRLVQDLSGGEAQRAQLARVLVQVWDPLQDGVPRWLFLDEPVAALDVAQQMAVLRIARAHAAGGGGVVAVMHDLNLTAMVADHVVLMKAGRCLAAGPVGQVFTDALLSTLYDHPVRVGAMPADGMFVLPQAAGM